MVAARAALTGLMPPLPTPFGTDGEIDIGALERNIERWNAARPVRLRRARLQR